MYCPFCRAEETKVNDSRLVGEGDQVRRRRECLRCHERFTTFERAELTLPWIVKRDGRREAFDENKLRSGIMRAFEKRPVSTEQLQKIISHIFHRLRTTAEGEVSSRLLGEWVMEELRRLDQVAYVRFASVYRDFQDVKAFKEEIDKLDSATPKE